MAKLTPPEKVMVGLPEELWRTPKKFFEQSARSIFIAAVCFEFGKSDSITLLLQTVNYTAVHRIHSSRAILHDFPVQ